VIGTAMIVMMSRKGRSIMRKGRELSVQLMRFISRRSHIRLPDVMTVMYIPDLMYCKFMLHAASCNI